MLFSLVALAAAACLPPMREALRSLMDRLLSVQTA
jgi:hypothetical protein